MITCGHRFSMGDECDWLISSSAVRPVNGNSSPAKILRKLMEAHCKTSLETRMAAGGDDDETEGRIGRGNPDTPPRLESEMDRVEEREEKNERMQRESPPFEAKTCETRSKRKERIESLSTSSDPENFEEAQHLDGCPVKWFHNRKASNSFGSCAALRRKLEQSGKINNAGGRKFRDRIPLEVKIGKINLNRRGSNCNFKNFRDSRKRETRGEAENFRNFEIDSKVLENQRKRLAVKLNWRPFQESNDHGICGTSNDSSAREGCRPKTILGGKSPISILLFPYDRQTANLRSCVNDKEGAKTDKMMELESSGFPEILDSVKIHRAKTAHFLGSSSNCALKKLQLPKQMNVSFYAPEIREDASIEGSPCGVKRQKERTRVKSRGRCLKGSQSLTSLSYALEDKTNGRKVAEGEYLMHMMKELSIENSHRGIRNFISPGPAAEKKKKETSTATAKIGCFFKHWPVDEHFRIICKKVKFSQRPQKDK